MKYILMIMLMCAASSSFAGECVNGSCSLRNRTANVVREVISVPVRVTKKTVQATRNVGRRTVSTVRNIVR